MTGPADSTGVLHMQPAPSSDFQLASADPTDALVFTVAGEGVAGEATVRVEPGQTRQVVIEVRAKSQEAPRRRGR